MAQYEVKLGKGGSATFKIVIHAGTPDEARRIAMTQYPGYNAQSVRRV